jgi:hypothetical protein
MIKMHFITFITFNITKASNVIFIKYVHIDMSFKTTELSWRHENFEPQSKKT